MKEIRLEYTPQVRQRLLHTSIARQIFYGGAAGGGKSHAIRWDAYNFCLNNPGLQAYLFRRTLSELEDNHIKFAKREIPPEVGECLESRKQLQFKNGSTLHFCYCDKEQDVYRYLGAEMHWIGLDEASRMLESQIQLLRTRNRLGGFKAQPDFARALPRFLLASNPGGPAHAFLKETFQIGVVPPEVVFHDRGMRSPTNPDDKGWTSLYIPARMRDNAFLDEGYEASFSGLAPELARAYREGDWDAVVGAAIHNLAKDRHMLRPFTPPKHWTRFMVMDWGVARPFSIGWYAVSEGGLLKAQGHWPETWLAEGALIRYAEWYGWNGRANQGMRLDSTAVARGIIERERERSDVMDYRVADSECWAKHDGPSVTERMRETDPRLVFRPSVKSRKDNYWEVISRLAGNPRFRQDGKEEISPLLFATENCRVGFWRTIPGLLLDESEPDKGPATKDQEDHCYDEVAYACASRPFVYTREQRIEEEEREYFRKMSVGDPYSTT